MSPSRTLRWPLLGILAAGLLSVGPREILAQSSTAECVPGFDWMSNTIGQNPCLMGAYLQGACNGGQFTVNPLPPDTHYTGPYVDEQNPCQCSSVTYNAISACGVCQNRTIITWSSWNFNCSTIYPGIFTPGVPDGTAVPQWAFQDVTTSDTFNVTLAQAVGDNPESTATHVQSTGSFITTATSASASLTDSSTASSSSSSTSTGSSSSSHTGAIAGGVVGGVFGAALITGTVVFFIMRKKRSRIPPSAQFASAQLSPSAYTDSSPFVPQMTQPRLYDPSDPSTFPTSPPPTTIMTGSSNDIPTHPLSPLRPSGYYSGAPEI